MTISNYPFIRERETDKPVPTTLKIDEVKARWSLKITANVFYKDQTIGKIHFDVPLESSAESPVTIDSIDSFYDDRYAKVGTYLVAIASSYAAKTVPNKSLQLSALPKAVSFYAKLGFVVDWSQYEDLETGEVSIQTKEEIEKLFESIKRGADASQNLYLRLSAEKCAALLKQVQVLT